MKIVRENRMAVYFCDVMDGLKSAFKNAGGVVSGNYRLQKRGLPTVRDQGFLTIVCAFGGLLAGGLAGACVDYGGQMTQLGINTMLWVWGGTAVGVPLVRGQLTSAYRASAHDKKMALLEAPKKMNALPAPTPQNDIKLI
jgi:hypothetical protein